MTAQRRAEPERRLDWPAIEPAGAILACWVRLLTIRMTDCLGRYEKDHDATARAAVRASDDAEYESLTATLPRKLERVEAVRSDLAVLALGRLPDLPWLDRNTHCRFGACGRPRRRKFPVRLMRAVTLASPPRRCQSCGWESSVGSLELDHMAEMWAGGPDAPFNLMRLCSSCHANKPLWGEHQGDPVMYRMAALYWMLEGRTV